MGAAEARAEEKKEEARDIQFIRFLDKKTAKKVEAAKSEAAQAESSKNNEKEKSVTLRKQTMVGSMMIAVSMAGAFLLMVVLAQKTPQGRAFKERASERLSGLVGRRNEKKQPLLPKEVDNRIVGA